LIRGIFFLKEAVMIKLEAATLTNVGRERQVNEDRVWAQIYAPSEGEAVGLFIVCDGVGGHLGGEVASQWAVEAVKLELANLFSPSDPRATVHLTKTELDAAIKGKDTTRVSAIRKLEGRVLRSIQKANDVVYEYARQRPEKAADAGTTITMAFVQGNRAIIANVGDSRTYLLRNNKMRQVTHDHSLVATLVANGQIQPDEIYSHPQRNLIFRSLGHKRQLQADTFVEVLRSGDYLLLCSDGLWEMVQDDQVMAHLILEAGSPDQACRQLVDAANAAGGEDNIGIVVVKVI
jgi:protein phosphatase